MEGIRKVAMGKEWVLTYRGRKKSQRRVWPYENVN